MRDVWDGDDDDDYDDNDGGVYCKSPSGNVMWRRRHSTATAASCIICIVSVGKMSITREREREKR